MPVTAEVKTTASEYVIPKLDDILSLLGIPVEIASDNGPPFNGEKFTSYLDYMGVKHRLITPYWPNAQGLVEGFMRPIKKAIKCAMVDGRDWRPELNKMLRNYRATPHPTTGIAPARMLFNHTNTSRLPRFVKQEHCRFKSDQTAREREAIVKAKSRAYTDQKRRATEDQLAIGDHVFARQTTTNKWMPAFNNTVRTVTSVNGCMVTATDANGHSLTRNRHDFKRTTSQSQSQCPRAETELDYDGQLLEPQDVNEIPAQRLPQRRSDRDRRPTVFYGQ